MIVTRSHRDTDGAVIYGLLVFIALAAIALYLLVIFRAVPGAVDERFGRLEDLPEHLGKWLPDEESEEGKRALTEGLRREVRVFHEDGLLGSKLTKQVRYRNIETNAIDRIEPEVRSRRRRIKD